MFGTGIGYKFDRDTDIDLTLMHLRSRDYIPAGTSSLVNAQGINNVVYNPFAGLDVQTKAVVNIMEAARFAGYARITFATQSSGQ